MNEENRNENGPSDPSPSAASEAAERILAGVAEVHGFGAGEEVGLGLDSILDFLMSLFTKICPSASARDMRTILVRAQRPWGWFAQSQVMRACRQHAAKEGRPEMADVLYDGLMASCGDVSVAEIEDVKREAGRP